MDKTITDLRRNPDGTRPAPVVDGLFLEDPNKVYLRVGMHFSREEIECRCGCGQAFMNVDFMLRLEAFRRFLGFPLPMTSGYRCPDWNEKIGGVELSKHPLGVAADIECTNTWKRARIIESAYAWGFYGLGIGQRMIHLDIRPEKDRRVWTYSDR